MSPPLTPEMRIDWIVDAGTENDDGAPKENLGVPSVNVMFSIESVRAPVK